MAGALPLLVLLFKRLLIELFTDTARYSFIDFSRKDQTFNGCSVIEAAWWGFCDYL